MKTVRCEICGRTNNSNLALVPQDYFHGSFTKTDLGHVCAECQTAINEIIPEKEYDGEQLEFDFSESEPDFPSDFTDDELDSLVRTFVWNEPEPTD